MTPDELQAIRAQCDSLSTITDGIGRDIKDATGDWVADFAIEEDADFFRSIVRNVPKLLDEAEKLMKENEDLRGYNAQCDLIAVENARLWKEKIDSLVDDARNARSWAALWRRKTKELYRVVSAFDEEHADIVTSNMRLARENGIMRAALRHYAGTAGAHARRVLSQLEKSK